MSAWKQATTQRYTKLVNQGHAYIALGSNTSFRSLSLAHSLKRENERSGNITPAEIFLAIFEAG